MWMSMLLNNPFNATEKLPVSFVKLFLLVEMLEKQTLAPYRSYKV